MPKANSAVPCRYNSRLIWMFDEKGLELCNCFMKSI